MRKIENKKNITKGRLAIALVAAFVLSLAVAIVLYFTVWSQEDEPEQKEPPVALDGEAVLNGSLMAYPLMQESKIQDIEVSYKTADGTYETYRLKRPKGNNKGDFELYYEVTYADGTKKLEKFYPNICDVDDDFTYSSLYSIEQDDGFGAVTKLKYLCMALMYPYVEERIDIIPEEKDQQLEAYGFSEGEYDTIVFTYLDENGNEKAHKIQIGDKTTLETGYYMIVDDRDCIYASFQNQLDYAFAGFYSFVKPIVVSPGIKEDTVISAYLTTNYSQWLNEMHKNPGDITTDDSRVIVFADEIVPVDKNFEELIPNGYINDGYKQIEFDLSKYKGKSEYTRLLNALTGKAVGDYSQNEIVFTLTGVGGKIDFANSDVIKYEYSVTEIEAIVTDNGEISALGTKVGANSLVKLAYKLKIGSSDVSKNVLHAVVDLSDAALPESFVSAVRASSVGTLDAPINVTFDYSETNSAKQNFKYVITELVSVFDKDGAEIEKVTANSIVTYRYRRMINGVFEEKENLEIVNLGTDATEFGAKIESALKGKSPSREKLNIVVDEYTEYCEYFMDFITYSASRIDYFVTKNIVSSFCFQNASERDPFYGESIYENTMSNKYIIYGLNNVVCQKVVNILTGINEEATTAPNGLIGNETVAVGLTPAVMEKYGLYAHTIYFELPRGIYVIENEDKNKIDDYAWYEILGFTLYVSDENPDGTRYVASDLYDIVAKVDGEKFVFLKYDFVNFFARREMMLTDVAYMQEATFELDFEDYKGTYQMELRHDDVCWGKDGKRYESEDDMPDGVALESVYDEITVAVTPFNISECTPNKLVNYINEKTTVGMVSLTQLYNKLTGDGNYNIYSSYDPLGTSNFKKLLENIYSTSYSGVISPEDQQKILSESKMIFRMSYKIKSSPWRYVYEFYRYDNDRVMVRLYEADYNPETNTYTQKTTAVSDFYISNFAFRKIVNNFVRLLNVEMINKEAGYYE